MASIQTRPRADGRASYRVVWRDPEGGLKSKTYAEPQYTAAEARDKAEELKNFLDANGNSFKVAAKAKVKKDSTKPTVSEVVRRHIDLLRKPQPGTITKYRGYLTNHIVPSDFGRTPVDRVSKESVITWMDELKVVSRANQPTGQPLSRKTKVNVHALVSDAFKTAVDEGVMTKNPARGVAEADMEEAEAEYVYLSEDDLRMLETEITEPYRLFIRTLSLTGLRYSEATALRRRDVKITPERDSAGDSWQRATIRVTRAWKNGGKGNGEVIGPPKSKKSVRNVECNRRLSSALIPHLATLDRDDYLFQRPNGDYLRNSWFHKEVWQPMMGRLLEEGKLFDKPRIHDIRAAHTTHLLDANVPVHRVQARLGHESPTTTLKIYSRLGKNFGTESADALD